MDESKYTKGDAPKITTAQMFDSGMPQVLIYLPQPLRGYDISICQELEPDPQPSSRWQNPTQPPIHLPVVATDFDVVATASG